MAMGRFRMEEEAAKNYLKCSVWDSWGLSVIRWAWKWSDNFLNPVGPKSRLRATMALENRLIQGSHWSGKSGIVDEGCKMSGEVMECCWWPGKWHMSSTLCEEHYYGFSGLICENPYWLRLCRHWHIIARFLNGLGFSLG